MTVMPNKRNSPGPTTPSRSRLALAALLAAGTVGLSTGCTVWDRWHLDYHRMRCWPGPFNQVDRDAVRAPFTAMVDKGWIGEHTLGEHLFDPQTHALTPAGLAKLRAIVANAPVNRRVVYVHHNTIRDVTRERLVTVRRELDKMPPRGADFRVDETEIPPPTSPADTREWVAAQTLATTTTPQAPTPALNGPQSASSGSGQGASGAGNAGSSPTPAR
ncbi:MAG TPA: hypothetical protein PLV92_25270 [Pirellulaceae bacterium]|nr:hypothetical protein [Pirellulaceae bacterium]